MAHKKGLGSSRNGRDSNAKRLGVKVEARVVGHERGPKLRVVKFKPKRGYKRRTGHRQDLTRIEVTDIKVGGGRSKRASKASEAPAPVAAQPRAEETKEDADNGA